MGTPSFGGGLGRPRPRIRMEGKGNKGAWRQAQGAGWARAPAWAGGQSAGPRGETARCRPPPHPTPWAPSSKASRTAHPDPPPPACQGHTPPANHPTETSRQHTGGHEDEAAQRQGPPAFSPQTPGRQGWGPSGGAGRTLKTSLSRTSTGRSSPSQGVRPRPASRAHGGSNSNGHRFIKTPGSDG